MSKLADNNTTQTNIAAERDELTGARSYFSLINGFDFEGFAGEDVYVVLCDVDDFRAVNDRFGEKHANEALARISDAIRSSFGDGNVCRYGSDEFIIVNAFFDEYAFLDKVEALQGQVSHIKLEGRALNLTLSIGYVHGPITSPNDLHEAIRLADRKMYEAKKLGKARTAGISFAEGEAIEKGGIAQASSTYKTYEVDELTGLSNLVFFRSKLAEALESDHGKGDDRLTLVYFNIENFKGFNERFGFETGDELLMLISEAIREAFPGCLAARFSADQFMVATTEKQAVEGILKVRTAFRYRIKDSSIWLKAGVNIVENSDDNVGLLCDRAKLACDAIKGRRDVFYRVYDNALKRQIVLHRYVLDHFDDALKNGWIKIFYQPIVRVATGEVCDEEALARWVDPEEGVIAPASFIPVLEEARLIHRLDLYMVRRACENMKRLREDHIEVAPVSINLSRLDFELCDIVAEVEAILDEFDVPHRLLSVEVTESALAGNQEFLKGEIDRFRADGFEVWMDDFGSGYSSLHLLTDYKFDLVKVDMGFLRDFEANEQTRIMLAHIISMSKELGLKTLVEGVETPEQLAFLKAIGCGRAQGYLLGRPASLRDVEKATETHEYPPIEMDSSHAFFEAVGRVNLMRPNPVPPIAGHYVPGDMAAAIICRTKGVYEYFNVTDMYRVHLHRMGAESVEKATTHLNKEDDPIRACFDHAIEHLANVGEWVDASYSINGKRCNLHVRLIAVYPEEQAYALLAIAQDPHSVE
ncbi:MAG: bifunctional diguanylate cyclase/phosphodiesterase [Eggerthellaceae bacterium]|nr:bifunctional diguanylate cyclase/phosphodiesterase [Eggerthellaceae bacterium]